MTANPQLNDGMFTCDSVGRMDNKMIFTTFISSNKSVAIEPKCNISIPLAFQKFKKKNKEFCYF